MDFIRVGALGLAGLSLPDLLATQAKAAQSKVDFVRDKAVVLLYLSGGASHIETFNPIVSANSGLTPPRALPNKLATGAPT